MGIPEGQVTPTEELEDGQPPEVDTNRDQWLEMAANDVDGALAALATAARHGRPLPRS